MPDLAWISAKQGTLISWGGLSFAFHDVSIVNESSHCGWKEKSEPVNPEGITWIPAYRQYIQSAIHGHSHCCGSSTPRLIHVYAKILFVISWLVSVLGIQEKYSIDEQFITAELKVTKKTIKREE